MSSVPGLGFISIMCVDVEDAKKLIGNKCTFEGREIELVRVSEYAAVVKHTDGSFQKIPWSKLVTVDAK